VKAKACNRGIISVRGLGDGTLLFSSLAGLLHSQDKVTGCGIGAWFLLDS